MITSRHTTLARGLALLAACAVFGCTADDGGGDRGSGGTGVIPPAGGAGGTSGLDGAGIAGMDMSQAGNGMTGAAGTGGMAGAAGAAGAGGTAGSAGTAGAGTGGTGGMGVAGAPGDSGINPASAPAMCPAAPSGASAQAVTALAVVNEARLAVGAGCATMITEINESAANHCAYYAANSGSCVSDPHGEMMGCTGFTGATAGDRMEAAGYDGQGWSEVMAFQNDPEAAIGQWINSVWHRLPILDPWITHLGYGSADGCDTIDFGRGMPAPDDTLVVYPYPGQVDVPTSFDGSREGPMPPAPSSGWPSGSPINVYAKMLTVTEHVLTVDGDAAPIEHVWLTNAESNFLRNGAMMYSNAAFAAQTTYRVKISGSYVGGPVALEWTFTTGDPPRWGRP